MKKVLVTGASGQLGKTFRELFLDGNDSFEFIYTSQSQLDITQKDAIDVFFNDNTFSYCLNFAAYTNVEEAEEHSEKASKINAEGVNSLALACKKRGIVLIHISTDYVFDGTKREPYTEEDTTNPLNAYGVSKLLGEKHIQDVMDRYYIIRTSWLYSAYNKNFVKTITSKSKQKANLKITNSQTGIPTSCIELSKFIYFILNNEVEYGIYNFTSKGETTWYDFALYIAEFLKTDKSFSISPTDSYITKAKRPDFSVLSTLKTEKMYPILKTWKDDVEIVLSKLEAKH